jgi:hypothetical protein
VATRPAAVVDVVVADDDVDRSQQPESGHIGPGVPAAGGDVMDGVAFDGAEYPAEAAVDSVPAAARDVVPAHDVANGVHPRPSMSVGPALQILEVHQRWMVVDRVGPGPSSVCHTIRLSGIVIGSFSIVAG